MRIWIWSGFSGIGQFFPVKGLLRDSGFLVRFLQGLEVFSRYWSFQGIGFLIRFLQDWRSFSGQGLFRIRMLG